MHSENKFESHLQDKSLVAPYAERTGFSDLTVMGLLLGLANFAFSQSASYDDSSFFCIDQMFGQQISQ